MLPHVVDGDHVDSVVVVPELPLFDAIFIAGLYHDLIKNRHVPFTRDCFPDRVSTSITYSLEYQMRILINVSDLQHFSV